MCTVFIVGFFVFVVICLISLILGICEYEENCLLISLVTFILAVACIFIAAAIEPTKPKSISQRYDELTAPETRVSIDETHEINETVSDTVDNKKISVVLDTAAYSFYKESNEQFYTLKIKADALDHFRNCRNCYALKRIQHTLNEYNVRELRIIHNRGSIKIKSSGIIQFANYIR